MARHQHLFPPAYPNSSSDCTWSLFCSFSASFNTLASRGLHRVPTTNLERAKRMARLCSGRCTQSTRTAHYTSGSTFPPGKRFLNLFLKSVTGPANTEEPSTASERGQHKHSCSHFLPDPSSSLSVPPLPSPHKCSRSGLTCQ